ncbi:MAG: 3-deoxy-D-manno-octulosonate 8-phosphate phosphatase [Chloroflexi bacterium]|nr:3-deoxy-D-manno-octulosonate 8-phosphate phosphatase [Chloroflexota bacterium]
MKNSEILKRCKKIKLVISDVDGVLTDGSMYYSEKGEQLKQFHTRDGMAVELLLQKNIPTIIITREKSKIVLARAKKIKIKKVYSGIMQKELLLPEISKIFNINKNEIAYIGDDINDEKIMKLVGLSVSPHDGVLHIKKIANLVTSVPGGKGVLRELADMIILSQSIKSS